MEELSGSSVSDVKKDILNLLTESQTPSEIDRVIDADKYFIGRALEQLVAEDLIELKKDEKFPFHEKYYKIELNNGGNSELSKEIGNKGENTEDLVEEVE